MGGRIEEGSGGRGVGEGGLEGLCGERGVGGGGGEWREGEWREGGGRGTRSKKCVVWQNHKLSLALTRQFLFVMRRCDGSGSPLW